MGLRDKVIESIAKRSANILINNLDSMQKADSSSLVMPSAKPGVLRYTFDPVYTNSNYFNKKKPDSTVSFDVLRNFSMKYEVARACINLRKRQLAGMEWDVITAESSDTKKHSADIEAAKVFVNNLGCSFDKTGKAVPGSGSYRRWINMVIEDLMALDALALYNVKNRGGELLTLLPVDSATIRLRIEGMGMPPPPPQIAYKQVIRGVVVAELTTDEMRYDMMNPRTNSPYGLSPLESLMITVSSALKSGLYNLAYLTDGNIPEGLVEAPKTWTPTQIKEFEVNWNAAMAGDDSATRRLHWLPAESKYTATKKPEDMAFSEFNNWLMQLTCAVFDVMPVEIGFSNKHRGMGDKGFNETQMEAGENKGLRPIANIIEEIINTVIQVDMGLPQLKFAYTGLDVQNLKEAAEINKTLIFSGQRTINEVRTDDGLEPIDGGDALFMVGQAMALNQEAFDIMNLGNEDPPEEPEKGQPTVTAPPAAAETGDTGKPVELSKKNDQAFVQLVTELRTLRKRVRTLHKQHRPHVPFESNIIPKSVLDELNKRLVVAKTGEEADGIVREYMSDYQVDFIHKVNQLRSQLGAVL